MTENETIREGIRPHPCTARYGCPTCRDAEAALDAFAARLETAEARVATLESALDEIEAKPYRAEEVIARVRATP